MSAIPVVDMSAANAPEEVRRALTERGFMYVRDHGIDGNLIARAFASAQRFFAQPRIAKDRFAYTDVDANFGFQGIEGERLDPASLPDLKEAFTMRNVRTVAMQEQRWPDGDFRAVAVDFHAAALASAYRLMAMLAVSLDLPADFFSTRHLGQNITLRFLHYPAGLAARGHAQLGAGAHTDYGSITLLFQDDVGGLEVRGMDGRWHTASPIPGTVVVNTGDLMERWTNGRLRSTLHRVRPVRGGRDRYSIALFVDPDTDVSVETIDSCISETHPNAFEPITAGEHIRRKIAATH